MFIVKKKKNHDVFQMYCFYTSHAFSQYLYLKAICQKNVNMLPTSHVKVQRNLLLMWQYLMQVTGLYR